MWTVLIIAVFGIAMIWLAYNMCEAASEDDDFVDEWIEKEGDDNAG